MNKLNVYMTTQSPNPPEDEDDEPQTYEEVHDDGDSGYGNSKD